MGIEDCSAPFIIGFLFTALNPYFLMWWFTIGIPLISEAIKIGALYGILLMFAFHIWMDYAWLGFAGYAAAAGSKFFDKKARIILSIALAAIILAWGAAMLGSSVTAYIR
ncbi:MAG: LysE family transporter [Thaumarchaeota archaeon]|nr:LysE family transporter [Nitrososphaerota archaeon]